MTPRFQLGDLLVGVLGYITEVCLQWVCPFIPSPLDALQINVPWWAIVIAQFDLPKTS